MEATPGPYQDSRRLLCQDMNVQPSFAPAASAAAPAPGTAALPWWERPMGPPTVPSPPPPAAGPPARAAPPYRATSAAPLDIRSLLHPAEHSRLLIALSSSAIVFGVAAMAVYALDGWKTLAGLAGALAAFGALVWLLLQVGRSRLLGGAVRVSETTLPELQSVFDEVRARLDHRKHVDVYVADKVDGGSAMTSYLGTRLIQIEGGLVAELLGDEHRAELTYLMARHIGQLKARHQRLFPIFLVVSAVDSLKFLQFFLAPYFRATAKSGDQLAAACCGDIRATAAVMNRLLVGKELGPRLVVNGVLEQAATVRRRWLPRLAQMFMSVPHATNRYLNLLAFFARVAPEEIYAWRATLDEATASRLTAVLRTSANGRAPRRRPNPVSMLLAILVTGGVLAACGWLTFATPGAWGVAASTNTPAHAARLTGHGSAATLAPAQAGSPSGQTPPAAAQQLLARMPPGFARTCQAIAVPAADASQDADAEVACQPAALGSGGYVTYVHYRTQGAMQSVYADLTRGVPSGNCTPGDGQGSYRQGSPSQLVGQYACYVGGTGHHEFAWTDTRLSILTIATSDSMSLADLYGWWLGDTGPE